MFVCVLGDVNNRNYARFRNKIIKQIQDVYEASSIFWRLRESRRSWPATWRGDRVLWCASSPRVVHLYVAHFYLEVFLRIGGDSCKVYSALVYPFLKRETEQLFTRLEGAKASARTCA